MLPEVEKDWPNEAFYDYVERCMKYQRDLQPIEKTRAVFKIFSPHHKKACAQVLADTKTWQDLCLFGTEQGFEGSFLHKINRTISELGRIHIVCMMAQPLTDCKKIKKRQRIIKAFVEDEQLYASVSALLKEFSTLENFLFSFWLQDMLRQASKKHYFSVPYFKKFNENLNKSEIALDVKTYFDHGKRCMWFISTAAAAIVLPIYGYMQYTSADIGPTFQETAERLTGSGGPAIVWLMSLIKNNKLKGLASAGAGWVCGVVAKEEFDWAYDNIFLETCLQEKLIAVSRAQKIIKELAVCVHEHEELMQGLDFAEHLKDYAKGHGTSDGMRKLTKLLKSTTFASQPSPCSRLGRVLVTYDLMHEVKSEWTGALAALGELDAYVALASLYKEYENKERRFCFVGFVEHDKPTIVMQQFWNPCVNAQNVVANSITVGGNERQNIIISGPNAGGKSTLLRSIAHNLILGQTFGIAAAQEMSITPFSFIATYLNIADDILSGTSMFKAQVLRAQWLLDKTSTLSEKDFSFIVVDEIFSGTAPREGQAASYAFAKYMGSMPNCISMIATHFPLLLQLQEETTSFANYKVSVSVGPDGTIIYPFTIQKGASDQNIAFDILRAEGFDHAILESAYEVLRSHQLNFTA